LSAKHVQIWGGCGIAATVLGHWAAGYLGDRVGRRASVFSPLTLACLTYELQPTMWVFCVIFIIGIIIEMVAKTWQSWLGAKIIINLVRGVVASTVITDFKSGRWHGTSQSNRRTHVSLAKVSS
jgi:MFS family permease